MSASSSPRKPVDPESLEGWARQHVRELWNLAKNSWLSIDRRTLGLTRILLGFYLVMDLFRRAPDWEAMFSDKGVLPNYYILERPQANHFSLLHAFTTAPELWVLFVVILAVFVCVLIGYRTRLAQIASLLIVTSMNGRVLLIENGGYVVQSLLLLWTAFLPLSDRFSLDAMLASMRRKRERTAAELNDRSDLLEPWRLSPHVSLMGLVLCLQIAAVYYFNVIHKFGPGWKKEWSAVFYVMYVDRMVTPLIAHTRELIPYPVHQLMTMMVVTCESTIGFCTLLPQLVIHGFDVKLWLKRIGLGMINFLHIGFGSTFVLGPFAWALCIFSSLFISYEDWDVSIRAMRRQKRARYVVFDPSSGATLWACRVLARMDRFGLLAFREAETQQERSQRISTTEQAGQPTLPGVTYRSARQRGRERALNTGHAAVADIVSALPIGPAFAWMLRVFPGSSVVDALLGLARGRASRFFGLSVEVPDGKEPSPLRGRFRLSGRVVTELACFVMLVASMNQAVVELWCTSRRWREDVIAPLNAKLNLKGPDAIQPQPEVMQTLTHKLRFLQGWFMFSPNPVTVDGTIVVDAVTVDGRHIDPFMLAPPNYDLINAKSYGYNQIWSDYFNRIQGEGSRPYQKPMLDYMRRLPERTGNPNDALVSGEVYWISDHNPRPKTTKSYGQQKTLLFTFGASGPPVYSNTATGFGAGT